MRTVIATVLVLAVCTPTAFARKWTDSNGQHSVEAEFVGFEDGNVRLKKPNGDIVAVPIEKLSKEDQDHVRGTLAVPRQQRSQAIGPPTILKGHGRSLRAVAFNYDSTLLAAGGLDRKVVVWTIPACKEIQSLRQFNSTITALAFSSDGKFLAAGEEAGKVSIFRCSDFSFCYALPPLPAPADYVAFRPDDSHLTVGGGLDRLALKTGHSCLDLWDTENVALKKRWEDFVYPSNLMPISPGEKYRLMTGPTRIVDMKTSRLVKELKEFTKSVMLCGCYSYDESQFADAAPDSVIMFDLQEDNRTRMLKRPAECPTAFPWCISFSPDGKWLACGFDEKTCVWNVESVQIKPSLKRAEAETKPPGFPAKFDLTSIVPRFEELLTGNGLTDANAGSQNWNEVAVVNPNEAGVLVALRSGKAGKDFFVAGNSRASVRAPNGTFDVYFVYFDKPDSLFQGDSFTLEGKGAEIKLVKIVGGNYGIKRVK